MTQKKANLTSALGQAGQSRRKQPPANAQTNNTATEPSALQTTHKTVAPSRRGQVPVTAHFPPDVRKQLKMLAVERDDTVQNLLAEAINDLFAKYGKAEIAPLRNRDDAD
jgi:septal ring factor EnvC (AmiA/AmiB activator)